MKLNHSAVFVSPVRDCSKYIRRTAEIITSVADMFSDYLIIFLESDSTDNSLEILGEISKGNDKILHYTLGDLRHKFPARTERLHNVRNFGLDTCIQNKLFEKFDYYICFDADDVNQDLTPEAVATCFKYPVDTWDAMFANQEVYYDLWTVRAKGWIEDDCFYAVNERPSYMSYDEAIKMFVHSKFISIPEDHGLIEVDSAYGGLGIYKASMIKDARYYGIHPSGKYEQCCIVNFCQDLKKNGARLFINSEMINYRNKNTQLKL
jgi:glycosyltransferase involved in cell wall biosynthesis